MATEDRLVYDLEEDAWWATEPRIGYARGYDDLRVYQIAFEAAMALFELSKTWPKEEQYALTDQVRRSSRSICSNIAEAWRKRKYPKHFVSKLSDADAEAAETENWLRFALACGYLSANSHENLAQQYDAVCRMLNSMMAQPDRWTHKHR